MLWWRKGLREIYFGEKPSWIAGFAADTTPVITKVGVRIHLGLQVQSPFLHKIDNLQVDLHWGFPDIYIIFYTFIPDLDPSILHPQFLGPWLPGYLSFPSRLTPSQDSRHLLLPRHELKRPATTPYAPGLRRPHSIHSGMMFTTRP